MVAAYALAAQMFFAGMAATQMAAADPADPFVICYGGHAPDGNPGKGGTPVNHASCVVCAFVSFAPPVPETFALAVASIETDIVQVALPAPLGAGQRYNPRSSQGPPQAA